MLKKVIILFTIAAIMLFGIRYGNQKYGEYQYNRGTVVAGPETESIAIYIEPDDTATRAAANYLIFSLERTLGIKAETVTEWNETVQGIRIFCGAEIPEPVPEQREKFIFITSAEAAVDNENPVYAVRLENNSVNILIPEREDCFGAVKAVTDRWLQKDCGLESRNELRISRAMIDRQLSDLSTAINGELRILTQNLRYCSDNGGNSINERATRFYQLVEEYQPDLIGTQECSLQWTDLLQQDLGDRYEYLGTPQQNRNDEWDDAILYRKDRFELKDGGTFWLSNTPDIPQSQLNYGELCRICTWALLADLETGETLLFSNTHLHHRRNEFFQEVRTRQAEILFRYLRRGENKLMQYPGFLTGDFNGESDEPFYAQVTAYYEDSGIAAITNSSSVDYTFHDYGQEQLSYDYCFYSPGKVTVLDYRILDDQYDGYISDHYGILVTAVVN